jgi:hypothetical protein
LETAAVEQKLIDQLVEQARSKGLQLTGEGGLLQQLTKTVLESALEGEITDHLGYDKHDPAGKDGGNSRNGTRSKTVLTDVGPVEIDVPRDREGSFEPAIVKKRRRRLTGIDETSHVVGGQVCWSRCQCEVVAEGAVGVVRGAVLQAVVEAAEELVEQVPKGCGVAFPAVSPAVVVGPWLCGA